MLTEQTTTTARMSEVTLPPQKTFTKKKTHLGTDVSARVSRMVSTDQAALHDPQNHPATAEHHSQHT